MEDEAETWFDKEGIDKEKRRMEYFLDMRYQGQNHEIRVPFSFDDSSDENSVRKAFTEAYERLYSFSSDDMVQIVNFGLSAIGDIVYPAVPEDEYHGEECSAAVTGERKVYIGSGEFENYKIYDRDLLGNGNIVHGPAIVEQMDSTTIIPKGMKGTVDKNLNIMLERE